MVSLVICVHLRILTGISTRDYVAAAYVSIFAKRPISEIENRAITLTELTPTGREVAEALNKKHGTAPRVSEHSLERVNSEVEEGLNSGSLFTLSWYCRMIWGTGQQVRMVGTDRWEVEDYEKATLDGLIMGGKLESYRELPPQVRQYFEQGF